MKRSLLLALVSALAIAAPVYAHESWHEATGAVSALSATSISVKGEVVPPAAQPTPDVLTCALTSRSPNVSDLQRGDRVYIVCDWVEGRQTLLTLVPQRVVRKYSGHVTRVSRTALSLHSSRGMVTCGVSAATRPKLRGLKPGMKVNMVCRKSGAKLLLVDVTKAGAHAGH